jgi:hypothetical protein
MLLQFWISSRICSNFVLRFREIEENHQSSEQESSQ